MAEAEETIPVKSADKLFEEFREVSVTEFFRKNKAHLGYAGKLRSLTTIIHEVVTNSLDACEEAGILPEVTVEIKQMGEDHYRFICQDNGPGIPRKHIEGVFGQMLAGTKFHRNVQLRGQQGIGVAGVTLYCQMTTGKPMRIRTSTGDGTVNDIKLLIDVSKNKADIIETGTYSEYWRGTELEGEVKGVQFTLREGGPYEYIRRTAVANPHAKIVFIDPEGRKTIFNRATNTVIKPPQPQKQHPKGMDVDQFITLAKVTEARRVSSFLMSDFSRISAAKVAEIQELVNFDMKKNPHRLQWAEAEEIVKAFEKVEFMAPPTEGLSPLGEEIIRKSILNVLEPEFEAVVTRKPTVHSGGIPFQVEVAIAYGGKAGRILGDGQTKSEVMRFANRAPLLFDAGGCALTEAVQSIDWKRYDIKDFENSPVTLVVNLVSTHVPYTSAGKQSVASDEEVVKEIRFALMDVGRKFQLYHSHMRHEIEKEAKLNTLLKYSTELAPALARLIEKDGDSPKLLKALDHLIREKLRMEDLEQEMEEGSEEELPQETFVEDKEA
ncbi:Type 2 DNA topoisomerase 6 subunit B [uncultured archaeon]|nr:Type 2 DNA topoisomerase 6 subunit B [uncultured archaeon]